MSLAFLALVIESSSPPSLTLFRSLPESVATTSCICHQSMLVLLSVTSTALHYNSRNMTPKYHIHTTACTSGYCAGWLLRVRFKTFGVIFVCFIVLDNESTEWRQGSGNHTGNLILIYNSCSFILFTMLWLAAKCDDLAKVPLQSDQRGYSHHSCLRSCNTGKDQTITALPFLKGKKGQVPNSFLNMLPIGFRSSSSSFFSKTSL